MITIPRLLLKQSTNQTLIDVDEAAGSWNKEEVTIKDSALTDDVLQALVDLATEQKETSIRRQAQAILDARNDKLPNVPKLSTAPEIVKAYLKQHFIKGWVWSSDKRGERSLPWAVTDITFKISEPGRDNGPSTFTIHTRAVAMKADRNGRSRNPDLRTVTSRNFSLDADEVLRKNVPAILDAMNLHVETQELHDEYAVTTERYRHVLTTGFAQQYLFDGMWDLGWHGSERRTCKVVHDVDKVPPFPEATDSRVFDEVDLPIQPWLDVFDLRNQESAWVHIDDVHDYEWDDSLRDKLVLPETQRELLDILTTDTSVFASDIVAGKSAGNVILCKGIPGVGKTLSAEVYSEITHKPLYAIHSGNLGTKPDGIREALEKAFANVKRWDAVLLLDECDVFILERGRDVVQNAIVAEFLRTLEYFDGLLFMTTNRPLDIDDAIISRCAAIIDYQAPHGKDARRVWTVLAENNDIKLSEDLLDELQAHFPNITPREIKMLLRLALRVSLHRDEQPTIETFRQCAIFRGLQFVTED